MTLRGGAVSDRERHGLRRPETATEPYECYLRGRQSLHRLQRADLENSLAMFERAISLDRRYAPAWAGVATVHALLFEWWGARDEDLQEADRASRTAMELAPQLADAQLARGLVLTLFRRYEEAEQHFEAAALINPNLFDAYYYQARACFARGEIARSAELFRKASAVRTEDFQSPALEAQSLKMLGRHEEARQASLESIARAEQALGLNPFDRRALALVSLALFSMGERERAFEWSKRSLDLGPDDMSALVCAACLHARAGQKDEALQILERVFARGWGKRDWIEHDPDYDSLRDDPRFQRLLARLK
jgi:tetratricopeptide (TPR) repeat protein